MHVMNQTGGRGEKLRECGRHASWNGRIGTIGRHRPSAQRVTVTSLDTQNGGACATSHFLHLLRRRWSASGQRVRRPDALPARPGASWLDAINVRLRVQCPTGALQGGSSRRPFDRSDLPG